MLLAFGWWRYSAWHNNDRWLLRWDHNLCVIPLDHWQLIAIRLIAHVSIVHTLAHLTLALLDHLARL